MSVNAHDILTGMIPAGTIEQELGFVNWANAIRCANVLGVMMLGMWAIMIRVMEITAPLGIHAAAMHSRALTAIFHSGHRNARHSSHVTCAVLSVISPISPQIVSVEMSG